MSQLRSNVLHLKSFFKVFPYYVCRRKFQIGVRLYAWLRFTTNRADLCKELSLVLYTPTQMSQLTRSIVAFGTVFAAGDALTGTVRLNHRKTIFINAVKVFCSVLRLVQGLANN